MALNLWKQKNIYRPLVITSQCYCDNKSIYQKHEEGVKPKTIHGELYTQWRKPWIEREGEWNSKLAVFVEKNPNTGILNTMQKIPDLDLKVIKDWWSSMKDKHEIINQRYMGQRVEILGSNLAAMHFFTHRGASVRLKGSRDWLSGDPLKMNFPTRFKEGYMVEAIDCCEFQGGGLRYEGVTNFLDLNFLKWLSLKNNKHIDVWCLDKLAGQNGENLEYLDISGCNISPGCIHALFRMPSLKLLVITDPDEDIELQTGLSLLEEANTSLLIKTVEKSETITK